MSDQTTDIVDPDYTADDLAADLAAWVIDAAGLEPPFDPAHEITTNILAERQGHTRDAAMRALDTLVERGLMTWRWAAVGGKRCKAYRRV